MQTCELPDKRKTGYRKYAGSKAALGIVSAILILISATTIAGCGKVNDLVGKLKDSNSDVSDAAAEALVEIGEPAVPALIKVLDGSNEIARLHAVWALGEIGDPSAVDPLIAALDESDMREAAVDALGKIGDPLAVEPLIVALKDSNHDVRYHAARALGMIGDPRAVEPLIEALYDRGSWVRMDAARALGEIGDPRAVEPLIAALNDPSEDVRHYAAKALGKIDDPRAKKALEEYQSKL